MLSISFGFKKAKGFLGDELPSTPLAVPIVPPWLIGTPSTTYKGSWLPLIEAEPLIVIVAAAPGSPLAVVTITPGVRPAKSSSGVAITPLLKSFVDRAATEPVAYTHLRAHETDSYLVCRLL